MRRLARWLIWGALGLAAFCAVGILVTVRRGKPSLWPPAPGSPTVTVFVVSHGYHAGIALPRGRRHLSGCVDRSGRLVAE